VKVGWTSIPSKSKWTLENEVVNKILQNPNRALLEKRTKD
jgi:hypothetical protein